MNKIIRCYIIQDNKILLSKDDYNFPDPALISSASIKQQIEMGTYEDILCLAVMPKEKFQIHDGFEFFSIKPLIRKTKRADLKLAGLAGFLTNWILNTQFCGRCGTENEMHSIDKARKCPNCGLINYPKFSPAIIVAVVKDDKILLAHNKDFAIGLYSTIAGFLDAGETFEECVKREILEEVNLRVKSIKYFGNQPWPFPDSHMIGFTAEYDSGDITEDKVEIEHADWFTAEDLPKIPAKGSISRELIDWFVENRELY